MLLSIRSISALVLLTLSALAFAQYPPSPYPYYPPPGHGGFGPGNTLNGAANVISATGQLEINQQQARVEQQKAAQAKITTKRKTFDEMMYEKANTPTFTEDQEKTDMMIVRRVLNHPLDAEVTSGKAQNILLPYLDRLLRVGIQGPQVPLDQQMLRSINVTTGKSGNDIGLLKNGGTLDWPLALRGPTQKKLDPLFPQLVSAASANNLDLKQYNTATKGVAQLQAELKSKFVADQIDGGMYLDGKRFLTSLESSLRALSSPSAGKFLSGAYAATGHYVPELVYNMTSKGLTFAPCTPGNEAPYFGLQSALASFAAGSEENNGFRASFDPFVQPKRKDFTNYTPK